ncbi:MAG TPA: glycoside hydrolase family 2 TIM barrel-domain containing protein [Bacilli bacterium]
MSKQTSLNGNDWILTGWYPNHWEFMKSMELGTVLSPIVAPIKVTVPGAVQVDLMAEGWLEDYNLGRKSLHGEWVNHKDWVYEKTFSIPDNWLLDRCELVLDGLDYSGEIFLNRKRITQFEGMFRPVILDITELLKEKNEGDNVLQIYFQPTPEIDGQVGYSNTIEKLKSRFNYGWDWCPRIVPVGIWKDVYLKTYKSVKLADFFPEADLSDDMQTGVIEAQLELEVWKKGAYTLEFELVEDGGQTICKETVEIQLGGGKRTVRHRVQPGKVNVWWPNGYGAQPLYQIKAVILDDQGIQCDEQVQQIGFRKAEFVQNEGAPEGALPYTLMMNGKRIFLKGVNWTTITPFYGAVTPAQYSDYLGRFKAMNTNVLRVNGVGIFEKRAFYDYCDRNGLMVWQDFPQSSSGINNTPPDSPGFLKELEEVARCAVKEKRTHPGLIIWCGGNELMWDGFIPVNDHHSNIRMLKQVVNELDPQRHFLPTSASGPRFNANEPDFRKGLHHDVHGPWTYMGEGEHYRYYNTEDALFRSEAGTPGALRANMIRELADGFQVWPPTKTNPLWTFKGAWWIQWDELNGLFGPFHEDKNELDMYCQASRYLQKESLRYAAESTRRREPETSGFLVWAGNEPYANTSNCSLIEFDGMPKPAFYTLQKVFSNLHVSARYNKLSYTEGEMFTGDLFVHEEDFEGKMGKEVSIRAKIIDVFGKLIQETVFAGVRGEFNRYIGRVEWQAAETEYKLFILRIELETAENQVLSSSTYVFSVNADYPLGPLRQLPKVNVIMSAGDQQGTAVVANRSNTIAVGVMIQEINPEQFVNFNKNDLILLPGEEVHIKCTNKMVSPDQLVMEGMNLNAILEE